MTPAAPVTVTEDLLSDITSRIVDQFNPHKVILFGSHAAGSAHAESDVDLFVIMESNETLFRRAARVRSVAQLAPVPMDIIVRTPAEVEDRLRIGDSFVADVLEKGRVLYERGAGGRMDR